MSIKESFIHCRVVRDSRKNFPGNWRRSENITRVDPQALTNLYQQSCMEAGRLRIKGKT